jgi:hypothetical protein
MGLCCVLTCNECGEVVPDPTTTTPAPAPQAAVVAGRRRPHNISSRPQKKLPHIINNKLWNKILGLKVNTWKLKSCLELSDYITIGHIDQFSNHEKI